MGRVLVALAGLLILTGCATVSVPDPGLSEVERQALQHKMSDSYWESSGLPDSERPTPVQVTVVSADDWPALFVKCMNDAGFDNYQVEAGGYSSFGYEGQKVEAEALASYVCSTSYWSDAGWFNSAQMNYLYDYYQQTLLPCLAMRNAKVWGAPSREKFISDGGGWHPYFSFPRADIERILADTDLPIECPPMPPGIDDRGYATLWD